MIVEDDRLLNKTLAYNLASGEYKVTSAFSAGDGEKEWMGKHYDLVLLDINLPDGNGCALCRKMKPLCQETIIIFLTANDQERDVIKGYEAGAVDYITKPFSIEALQRKIKSEGIPYIKTVYGMGYLWTGGEGK